MMQDNQHNQQPAPKPKPKNNKMISLSDLAIGGARGGPLDKLIMLKLGKSLKQWADDLHGWVE